MIPDDELQANADATLPDFYGPTKWPVEILVPTKELAEMRDEITRLKAENEKLAAELAASGSSVQVDLVGVCAGCGLPEMHKMCPAYGTDIYMTPEHPAWGSVHGIAQLLLATKEIRWTDAKPTTPGWWWRRVGEGHEASCAFVGTGWEPGELLVQLHRHNGLWKIESLGGQWSDKPIPMPEERT